ncbi:hypothetical protein GN244_ATG16363 [Phytophthora infestans]|uniref:Tc1-like transposase DDE domain-containing protein n=1 Tax=Phytophthora infestans TaxID=4787 RepID=A0A833S3M9_PHYIN|nr:hypothetical protein GN244_ATG16363 [Phytophthora infestans]KAF4146695.1 hypothetical protein GN958_ATG04108 [Phytophthora infestans]
MGPIRKEYSHDLRCRVVQKWRAKISTRTISKALLIPGWSTRAILDFNKANVHCKPVPRPGRTPLTDTREDLHIVLVVEANRFVTQLTPDLGVKVSSEVVRALVKAAGLHRRSVRTKPYLSRRQHCPEEKWRTVLFSDEASVELHDKTGRISVWRRSHMTFDDKCVLPTFLNFHVSRSWFEHLSVSSIAPYLDPTSPLRNSSWIYKVTLFATSSWLKELKLKSFGHPPQSPGLNPIENLWFLMKPELSKDPALAQLSWNLIRRVET